MTAIVRPTPAPAPLRSVAAVLGALVLNAIAAAAVDQVMIWLGVFPEWGVITYEPLPYVLAVGYRALLGVGAAWLAARWAPRSPMRHALWLGAVGVVLSLAGVAAALTRDMGPVWYPVVLVAITMPAAWLGGALQARGRASR